MNGTNRIGRAAFFSLLVLNAVRDIVRAKDIGWNTESPISPGFTLNKCTEQCGEESE